jgi:hypothetical protein
MLRVGSSPLGWEELAEDPIAISYGHNGLNGHPITGGIPGGGSTVGAELYVYIYIIGFVPRHNSVVCVGIRIGQEIKLIIIIIAVGKKQQHSSRHRHNEDANRSSRNYFGDKSQTFWQYRESKYPYHLIVSFELPPADLYSRFHHIIPTSFKKRGQYFLATLLILCSRFHHISSDVDIVTKSIKKKGHNFLAIQNVFLHLVQVKSSIDIMELTSMR